MAQKHRISWSHSAPFLFVHFVPFLAFWADVQWTDWVLCGVLYVVRMFFLTAGYHRYFAHRSYKLGRVTQFVMAFGGSLALQKGVLFWAAHHQDHHRYSDTDKDIHSPIRGFWWSHMFWFMSSDHKDTKFHLVKHFAKYPELRWLNRWWIVPPAMLGLACWWFGGMGALLIGFFLSSVLLWHGTFTINSLAHVWGRRRFDTGTDDSRNNFVLALITLGEGWHNNHHHLQTSARQGFYWWEVDVSWYVLKVLTLVKIAREPNTPSRNELAQRRLIKGVRDAGKETVRKLRDARKRAGRYYDAKKQAFDHALESAKEAAGEMVRPPSEKAGLDP